LQVSAIRGKRGSVRHITGFFGNLISCGFYKLSQGDIAVKWDLKWDVGAERGRMDVENLIENF
jgi:hypothetical protein